MYSIDNTDVLAAFAAGTQLHNLYQAAGYRHVQSATNIVFDAVFRSDFANRSIDIQQDIYS